MINFHEIEEAIKELEEGSSTYNNCMKLASLYIIRDEMRKEGQFNQYARNNYGYYPMYERGGRSGSSYGYRPMYYHDDDLMIRKQNDGGLMYENQNQR